MPFRYQLQKVLDLMENREKSLDAQVLDASRRRAEEARALDELEARKLAAQKGLGARMSAGATSDVAASNDYIQALGFKIDAQTRQLKAADQALEAAKARQTEARQERQKIEKHKAMKLELWKVQEKKREAQRTDEMAGTIFMKRRAALDEEAMDALERLERLEKLRLLQALRDKRS